MNYLIPVVILIGLAALFFKYGIRRTTILEYERGLLYVRGKFGKILEPGQYWHSPLFTMIQKTDIRPRFVSITGQEVLSADGISLKLSIAAHYEITDPWSAIHKTQNFQETLYLELQLALRAIISAADIEAVLKKRNDLSAQLMATAAAKAENIGLKLLTVSIKDILFPGKLKEVFAQVVNARQEGLAALEKARGETAALRSLANAAKMIESNPALFQLRLAQTLGQSSGNTLALNLPAFFSGRTRNNTADGSTSLGATEESR